MALKAKTVTDGKVTEWEFGETGGFSENAATLLIAILSHGIYDSNQADNIEALKNELFQDKPLDDIEVSQNGNVLLVTNVPDISSVNQSGKILILS